MRHDVAHDRQFGIVGRTSRHQHLDSALDARERIAHLVGDDGGHLPDAGESGLLCQAFLGCLASGDVGADGYARYGFPRVSRNGTMVVSTQ